MVGFDGGEGVGWRERLMVTGDSADEPPEIVS